jgi:2-dehydropantoate 2-reductase
LGRGLPTERINVEKADTGKATDHSPGGQSRVLVVGTGAIGGFYGGRLALAGARVATLCRSDYEEIRDQGITVTSVWGDFHYRPERVVRRAGEYGPPPDFILVALKALPGVDTVEIVRDAVGPDTAIVLVQNGIGIDEPVAAAFPRNEIISAVAFIAVSRTGPGRILHSDYGRLVLGRFPSGTSAKVQHLTQLLRAGGVPCEVAEDVVTARWRKLVWNAPFNPMSVVGGGVDTETMVEMKESADVARATMEEVLRIAAAAGHPLPTDVIEQNFEGTRAMKPFKTSMLADFEAGRPMEIEAIVGNALRIARSHRVEAPHLETLYALLKLAERRRR